MQIKHWSFRMALSAGLLLAVAASAEDSFAPCWRGQTGTTYQNWNFDTASSNPAAPDFLTNPNGSPSASVATGLGATGWRSSYFGRTGAWDVGQNGSISLSIPNFSSPSMPWKYVQVQVTYLDSGFGPSTPAVSLPGATLVSSNDVSHESAFVGTWKTQRSLWRVQPSPASESVAIACASPSRSLLIDQIVVDTRCPLGGDGDVPANQPCWRGQVGTTFQHWMFGLSNNPSAPELVSNPYGAPSLTAVPGSFSSAYITEDAFFGCRYGLWNIGSGGSLTATIPNNSSPSAGTYKYVQVQVMQYRDGIYSANAGVSVPGAAQVGPAQETIVGIVAPGRTWVVHKTLWKFTTAPVSETVVISAAPNGSVIDQLVVDTLAINPPCPGDITVDAGSGQCSAAGVSWSQPAIGCLIASVSNTTNGVPVSNPGTFPVGVTVVTSTITDLYGSARVCTFSVVVHDKEAPTVAALPNLTVAREAGQCGAHVTYAASAADNCSGATVVFTPPSGSLLPLGLSTVTYYAVDGSGNQSAASSFIVRVVDYLGDIAANQPCWRGQAGTTFQQWAFSVSDNPALPELASSAGGSTMSVVPGFFSLGYIAENTFFGCHQGMWNIGSGGSLTAAISDNGAGSYRYVQVQVMQYRDGIYSANAGVSVAGAVQVGLAQEATVETVAPGRTWVVQKTLWKLSTTPDSETVVINAAPNGSVIDQVIVDTLSLQNPACPADITANADPGQCSKANVTWAALPAVDGCLIKSASDSPASGSTFAVVGSPHTVTRTIMDAENQPQVCTFTVTINDVEPPVISDVTASQIKPYVGAVNVKDGVASVVQGVVNITVAASDSCPLPPPTIQLVNGANTDTASYVSNHLGVFYYTWTVGASTANGTWTATAAAADSANMVASNFTLNVNTLQITGQVELQGFMGTGTVPLHSRTVTFVATGGASTKTWTLLLTNISGAIFDYALTDVPSGTTHVSAKTAWNLRRKVAVTYAGANGFGSHVGAYRLLSGDINGSNNINAADRSTLLTQWGQPAPGNAVADLNGDGNVNVIDRGMLLGNWGGAGDSE